MSGTTIDTAADGTVVIHPHGQFDAAAGDQLRRTIVQVIRRERPRRLVLDLHNVAALDAIDLGTLVAACQLGDDHQIPVFLDHPSATIADQLMACGVPANRLRNICRPGA